MPESITIFFDSGSSRDMTIDPADIDSPRECEDALEELLDYLDSHHISYFRKCLNRDEFESDEENLIKSGAREVVK